MKDDFWDSQINLILGGSQNTNVKKGLYKKGGLVQIADLRRDLARKRRVVCTVCRFKVGDGGLAKKGGGI